mgnify:CR=1 FL=1
MHSEFIIWPNIYKIQCHTNPKNQAVALAVGHQKNAKNSDLNGILISCTFTLDISYQLKIWNYQGYLSVSWLGILPKMTKVLLHIGIHKTGTSSIQQAFRGYDDGTTKMLDHPSHFGGNHTVLMQHMFADYSHHFRAKGWGEETITATRVKWLQQFHKYLDRFKHDRLVISGEGMRNLKPIAKKNLVEFFEAKNFEVEVLCIVRHPADWALSAYQQNLKSNTSKTDPVPGYERSLATFAEILPKKNILVRDFRNLLDEFGDIVLAFSDLLNLKLDGYKAQYSNQSLSFLAAKILYNFNESGLNKVGTDELFKKRNRLINFLHIAFKDNSKPWPKDELKSVLQGKDITRDVDYLQSNFNINYEIEDRVRSSSSLDKIMSELDVQELHLIHSCLEKYGVKATSEDISELCKSLDDSLVSGTLQHFAQE